MAYDDGINDGGLGEALAHRLLSDREFAERFVGLLSEPPFSDFAFHFVVKHEGGEVLMALHSPDIPDGEPSHTQNLRGDNEVVVTECRAWHRPTLTRGANAVTLIQRLHRWLWLHWCERDPMTMLPYARTPKIGARFLAAARDISGRSGFAVMYLDLDKFKAVNEEHGMEKGHQVLAEFGRRLRHAFSHAGVVVRLGGEEFSAILAEPDAGTLLVMVECFLTSMRETSFEVLSRPNTCSIGLSLYDAQTALPDLSSVDTLLKAALEAEGRAKQEGRDCMRLVGDTYTLGPACRVDRVALMTTALAARRLGLVSPDSQHEAFLGCLVDRLAANLQRNGSKPWEETINDLKRTLGVLVGEYVLDDPRPQWRLGILGPLEWAAVAAAGLMAPRAGAIRPADRISLQSANGKLTMTLAPAEGAARLVVVGMVQTGPDLEVDLGPPEYLAGTAPEGGLERWRSRDLDDADGCNPASPVLLLPIGDAAADVAEPLRRFAADVIHIDDRPAIGGGLPDFWQSNLARVLRACLANPNICVVAAAGNPESARLTLERLREGPGEGLEVQRQLSLPARSLQLFRERKIEVRELQPTAAAMLELMLEAAAAPTPTALALREQINPDQESRRRRLPIPSPDESTRLTLSDGLKARTLADAYPQAVQLIRGVSERTPHRELSRREFRELTGFKLVLTHPLSDRVPDYWSSDPNRLEDYYKGNFDNPGGVFGRSLHGPFMDVPEMRTYTLNAAVSAVKIGQPTRRLNIPVLPKSLSEPLGLTSIQLMPRMESGRMRLDAIWIWRTVDALVGFPFSAYGSIRWTDDFVSDMKARLEVEQPDCQVEMGELTYIALSFHMYLHEGDQEIARAIVQDASR